ncbi:MAG: (Fe-S)-binding protein [Anaerolineales bacterium]|nr:(Fe-S)-binding protein [Anaerolineales bacterium]
MLTIYEQVIFSLAVLISLYVAWGLTIRIRKIIARGKGNIDWKLARKRIFIVILKIITFQPVFRFRFWPSFFHGLVAWGFIYYLIVNLGDVLEGFILNFHFLGTGIIRNLYVLGADLLSVAVLIGMVALVIRRFILKSTDLSTRDDILLHPKAAHGIRRDSAIVSGFIIIHVGARFFGETFSIAANGNDPWQPFANSLAGLWFGLNPTLLVLAKHIAFWLALGTILLFIPYFIYSKHIHLFFAPLNFLLKPERRSLGELNPLDFEDETLEQFGATRIEDLDWELIMDAYACIMCFRCQDVCPAYNTGKVLSPATLEINKRYFLNQEGVRLAKGKSSSQSLIEFAIPTEAVWACTACGACVDICPVGNEPMRDILDIRRALVLMENNFPDQLQTAFRGMERTSNPWSIPSTERMKWAEGLEVPTIEENPNPDILWWVGCAPATDARAQKTARAFIEILNAAGVNYAVLGNLEQCTGDSARRAGNEYLFHEMALSNVEILNEASPKRIVTTCPHCLHTIKNEYPAYGGDYQIIHHSQLINELIADNRLNLNLGKSGKLTFHDPCYLGRQNDVIVEPRKVLQQSQNQYVELPRSGKMSFCCGAGGAQMWKEEEDGLERVSTNRIKEAYSTGADLMAVGCPFCMIMLSDANSENGNKLQVMDIAEIVARQLSK